MAPPLGELASEARLRGPPAPTRIERESKHHMRKETGHTYMQDIMDYADVLTKWRTEARSRNSLEELSIAARAAMDCPSTERASAKGILLQRSEVIGCKRELAGVFRALESDRAQARIRSSSPDPDAWPYLTRDGQGRIACTIENFSWILQTDEAFRHLKYDALADAPVLEIETEDGKQTTRPWTDVDDAHAMEHIEAVYALCRSGKAHAEADLPGQRVRKEYGRLCFAPAPETADFRREIPFGTTALPELSMQVLREPAHIFDEIHNSFNTFFFKSDSIRGKICVGCGRGGHGTRVCSCQ